MDVNAYIFSTPQHEPLERILIVYLPSGTPRRHTNPSDAIAEVQRAMYVGPETAARAEAELKAGRRVQFTYGFTTAEITPEVA